MANILDFLRGVLTDGDAQSAFRADPMGNLTRAGFGDLTGEDIVEGVAVLRRSLPDGLASSLAAFDDEDHLPPIRPTTEETDLDAAARLLTFAVDQLSSADRRAATVAPEPEPAPAPGPEVVAEEPPAPEAAAVTAPPAPPAPPAPSPPVTLDPMPSVAAFGESMAAVAADARARVEEAIRQVVAEVDAVRARSDEYAAGRRAEADADREAALEYLERTRQESDSMLERARQHVEEARQEADSLLDRSRAEVDAMRVEVEAQQGELHDAEDKLKQRLTGIDSLFRTVLREDPKADG
jgi:hypothetical protein